MSYTQNDTPVEPHEVDNPAEKVSAKKHVPHKYGGWYCPDNLFGFPAVDINNWESVPVVNGRMATQEETRNGTSLISVDMEKYPDAKPLDIKMPKLARFYNRNSGQNEIIIVIQALNISNDSIVGFRYLNGGNGSARLNEVRLLTDQEIEFIAPSRFVTFNIKIDATQQEVFEVLTKPAYNKPLKAIFDKENKISTDWNESSEVNFIYRHAGLITSAFAGDLFGNMYIQIDSKMGTDSYVQKFLLSENDQTKTTELQIVCGPYSVDFESQKIILENWAQKVKALSEKK
jgi:hypothetical protein